MVDVVGAGMSGLAAGLTLVKNESKVTVYEQHKKVGFGCGHNIMAIRNYDLPYDQMDEFSNLGLKLHGAKPIYRIIKYAPSGRSMEVFSKDKPIFYAIMRGADSRDSWDLQLSQQFENEGGIIKTGEKKSLKFGDIIATRSVYSNFWCIGTEFNDVQVDDKTILFFMDDRYCPQGYIYLMPWGKNEVSIAATTYNLNCPLFILFKNFLENNKIISKILEGSNFMHDFGGSAYSNVPKSAKVNGKLFVGSAAGFLDSARGFGIKHALISGILAGKSINENLDYDKLWKNAFEEELLESFSRRLILEKMTNLDYEKLILKNKLPIQDYDKLPEYLSKILKKIKVSAELNTWRRKYDLNKLYF